MEIKQFASDQYVPVMLKATSDGLPWTGVTYDQVTCILQPFGCSATTKVLSAADWYEVGPSIPGLYQLSLTSFEVGIPGIMMYAVSTDLTQQHVGYIEVRRALAEDIYDMCDRLLGLTFENVAECNQVYNAKGKVLSADIRCYDTPANAIANGGAGHGLKYLYRVTCTYDVDGNATSFICARDP